MFQVINEPTRITQNGGTILDLIITNCVAYFVYSGTSSPPAKCDHSLIFAKMNIQLPKEKCYERLVWNFNNANETDLLHDFLTADWGDNSLNRDVNSS